ncbi:MAG: NADH-quinone oxidoreductase subunit M, partial [Alphaproteobacteria bacterium]|nr:NADH-quinone oxidoreductase subunit M [Alphaproteobacteria bacterium]
MPLLSLIVFLPLVGVLFLLLLRGPEEAVARNAFWMALWVSSVTLLLSLAAWFAYDGERGGFQLVEENLWIPQLGLGYRLGVDGISLPFVVLSALLTPLVILASRSIRTRVRDYMILFLVLETFMLGTFCALDLLLFYVFFEGVLIPMFIIIGVWGGPRRIYSAFKFFLYTLLGSILMLLGFLYIWSAAGTANIMELAEGLSLDPVTQRWLWLASVSYPHLR